MEENKSTYYEFYGITKNTKEEYELYKDPNGNLYYKDKNDNEKIKPVKKSTGWFSDNEKLKINDDVISKNGDESGITLASDITSSDLKSDTQISLKYYGVAEDASGNPHNVYVDDNYNYYYENGDSLDNLDAGDGIGNIERNYSEEEGFEYLDSEQLEESSGGSSGGGGSYQKLPIATPNNILDHIGDSQDFVYTEFYAAMKTAQSLMEMSSNDGPSLSVEKGGLDINIEGLLDCKTCIGSACGIGANQNIEDLVKSLQAINQVVIDNDSEAKEYFENMEYFSSDQFAEDIENGNVSEQMAKTYQSMCLEIIKKQDRIIKEKQEQIEKLQEYEEILSTITHGTDIGTNFDSTFPFNASVYLEALNSAGIDENEMFEILGISFDKSDTNSSVRAFVENNIDQKIGQLYGDILSARETSNIEISAYCNMYQFYNDFNVEEDYTINESEYIGACSTIDMLRSAMVRSHSGTNLDDYVSTLTQEQQASYVQAQNYLEKYNILKNSGVIDELDISRFEYLDPKQNQVNILKYMLDNDIDSDIIKRYSSALENDANKVQAAREFDEFVSDYYKRCNILLDEKGQPVRDENGNLKYDESNQRLLYADEVTGVNTYETKSGLALYDISWEGLGDGFSSFSSGIKNLVNSTEGKYITSASMYKNSMIIDFLSSLYGGDTTMDWVQQKLTTGTYNISTSICNMIPSIAASTVASAIFTPAVGSLVGSTLMGASCAGNSMVEGYSQGMSEKAARMYGIFSGLSEAGMEYLLGGISGLSMPRENISFIRSMLSEGVEESIQEIIGNGLLNASLGYQAQELSVGQIIEAGIYGMITAGIMNGTIDLSKTSIDLLRNSNTPSITVSNIIENNDAITQLKWDNSSLTFGNIVSLLNSKFINSNSYDQRLNDTFQFIINEYAKKGQVITKEMILSNQVTKPMYAGFDVDMSKLFLQEFFKDYLADGTLKFKNDATMTKVLSIDQLAGLVKGGDKFNCKGCHTLLDEVVDCKNVDELIKKLGLIFPGSKFDTEKSYIIVGKTVSETNVNEIFDMYLYGQADYVSPEYIDTKLKAEDSIEFIENMKSFASFYDNISKGVSSEMIQYNFDIAKISTDSAEVLEAETYLANVEWLIQSTIGAETWKNCTIDENSEISLFDLERAKRYNKPDNPGIGNGITQNQNGGLGSVEARTKDKAHYASGSEIYSIDPQTNMIEFVGTLNPSEANTHYDIIAPDGSPKQIVTDADGNSMII